MIRKSFFTLVLLIGTILAASCSPNQTSPTTSPNMANPASVFCEQQGNTLEIRTATDGSQSGVCIFPDGSECDEWAYFRGECKPADPAPAQTQDLNPTDIPTPKPVNPADYQGWWTYTNATYGFSCSCRPTGVWMKPPLVTRS